MEMEAVRVLTVSQSWIYVGISTNSTRAFCEDRLDDGRRTDVRL